MRVVVTTESRCLRTPDARVWVHAGPSYPNWSRYLAAFRTVRVVARVRDVPEVPAGASRVDGEGVEVWPVPHYQGPAEYLRRQPAVRRAVTAAAAEDDAVVLRVPSPIGSLLAAARERRGLPYALEVIGDPYDVFAPGTVRHPLRPVLRHLSTRRLRHQCRTAVGAAYVTEQHLQRRYPVREGIVSTHVSSVYLPAEAYVGQPRVVDGPRGDRTIVSVGTLAQLYKGVDTLLTALARLAGPGRPRLVHLGDGRFRTDLERLAERLGMADRVTFAGVVPTGAAVRRHLDAADLFVMPSRTEGLPQALIEAMARALPAVGTRVGGIPELLAAEDLVPPDDPAALAGAIDRMLADPERMTAASARNLARSRDFSADTLARRRTAFYRAVAAATAQRGHRPLSEPPATVPGAG
ncbi:glycosyltransferase family 4 protein [Plantactinospora sp. WMMB782]|uniref:glycosyltransferase family 4 protein n=1 Tax=Plantactinospora sp. WMMB782 TaxID=3404121 RepID=UPI003B94F802